MKASGLGRFFLAERGTRAAVVVSALRNYVARKSLLSPRTRWALVALDDGADSPIETIKYVLSWWRLIRRRQRRQGVLDGGRGRHGCRVPGPRLANDRSLLRDERLGDGHVAHLHARPVGQHDRPVRELVLPRVAARLKV